MRPDPTRRGRRLRFCVLGLLLVGALTLITYCGGNDGDNTGPGPQAADADLSGTDAQMHHAVG